MFIYQFNRLIRSRILWAFFAVIIAFAFVSVDSCFRQAPRQETAGKLGGKRITNKQFEETLNFLRGAGAQRDNETPSHVLERRAWEQLAALYCVRQNGLTVGAEEVRNSLKSIPQFQGPNGFDMNLYRMTLAQQGVSPETFENIVTRSRSMQKIDLLLSTANWISPMELEDELSAMTDRFSVQTATFSNEFAATDLPVSDEMLQKYYAENSKNFALPDRVAVHYVAYPVTNYMAHVNVTEDDMRDFYDGNLNQYTRTDTNDVSVTLPFEEVKEDILTELKMIEARHVASTSVVFNIFGKLINQEDGSIQKAAQEAGLAVQTSPLFDANAQLPWVERSQEFSSKAFELDAEDVSGRYNVAEGDNFIYLMELAEFSKAHVPTFEEVLTKIRPRVLAQERASAFEKKVATWREDLTRLMEKGQDFAAAATQIGALNVSTALTYTVNDIQNNSFSNNYSIAYGAMALQKGETSEAIPIANSQALLVHVLERTPGDALAAEMMRAQIASSLAQRRHFNLTEEWLTWNLEQMQFEPLRELLDEDDLPVIDDPDNEA